MRAIVTAFSRPLFRVVGRSGLLGLKVLTPSMSLSQMIAAKPQMWKPSIIFEFDVEFSLELRSSGLYHGWAFFVYVLLSSPSQAKLVDFATEWERWAAFYGTDLKGY